MNAIFERHLAADLSSIVSLADEVVRWGSEEGLAEAAVFQINLVLEELVTNVITHGLGVGQPGGINVRIERTGDRLEIALVDDALPFDPFSIPTPDLTTAMEDRPIGGLGVHLIRTLMDEWGYARVGGQNVVWLRKTLDERKRSS
jgi:anti-sigma regulatory factor (Ser/Thr protein kinase)